jgi:hypothetical protein
MTTSDGSPPHDSRISLVAISSPGPTKAGSTQPPPGRGGADRIEQRRLDEHLGCRLGTAGPFATDHAAKALHPGLVGDRGHFRIERVFAAVERQHPLAGLGEAHGQVALELAGVEDVQRPVHVEGQEIGDVDQSRDRPQPDCLEPVPEPARARPVLEAADMTAKEQRAGDPILNMDGDRRAETTLDRGRVEQEQSSDVGRGEVAGDAAHAEAVRTVGRHLDVDDRVVEAEEAGIAGADRRVGWQFDNAGMILGKRQLGSRHQHALRRDAADRGFGQHRAGLRNAHAGRAEHALHPGPGVGRAAYDLDFACSGINHTDTQSVGVRMRLGLDDSGDDKAVERRGAVLDPLDIVAEHDQPLDKLGKWRLGVEMRFQPGQRRLHQAAPPASGPRTGDGMSSGRKP